MKGLGIVLIIVGALMVAITGFNYSTKKNIVDIGPLEVNKEVKHPVRWSPIVGGLLLVGGIVVVVASRRKAV